jgi:hypothetical protein
MLARGAAISADLQAKCSATIRMGDSDNQDEKPGVAAHA